MKTLILKKQEMDSLSPAVQNAIMEVYHKTKCDIKKLKNRINALPFKSVSYRTDLNSIEDTRNDKENLTFVIWEKTGGEQWGNSQGEEFTFYLGYKYIRLDVVSYCTNRSDWPTGSVYISASKLSEILDLLEEGYFARTETNEIDRVRILSIACSRVKNLF